MIFSIEQLKDLLGQDWQEVVSTLINSGLIETYKVEGTLVTLTPSKKAEITAIMDVFSEVSEDFQRRSKFET